jgi:hypothetical protein
LNSDRIRNNLEPNSADLFLTLRIRRNNIIADSLNEVKIYLISYSDTVVFRYMDFPEKNRNLYDIDVKNRTNSRFLDVFFRI